MPLSDQVQPGEETSVKISKFPPYPYRSTTEEETAKPWGEKQPNKPKKRRLSKAKAFTVRRKTPKEEQTKIVTDKSIPAVK